MFNDTIRLPISLDQLLNLVEPLLIGVSSRKRLLVSGLMIEGLCLVITLGLELARVRLVIDMWFRSILSGISKRGLARLTLP